MGLRLTMRAVWSLGLAALCLWLLMARVQTLDWSALRASFQQTTVLQWLRALGWTAVSFWAVGRYDGVIHRHFATLIPAAQARRAGVAAIAVSQALGLGLITGALLRWRMLPSLSLLQASRLTLAVALSFLAGWAVVTAMVLLALPEAPYRGMAAAVLALACLGAGISLVAPQRLRLRWPNGFTLSRLIGLCAVDSIAAALALHALCPPELALPFATLLPAFLLAFGAGLVMGTPGGMGPFEIALLALLPLTPAEPLLAAVLAWRVVYFALPAVLGAGLLLRGPALAALAPLPRPVTLPRAEMGLARQGNHQIMPLSGTPWLLGHTAHHLIGLAPPRQMPPDTLRALIALAAQQSRLPLIYKAPARLAATARAMGWTARRTGWEAVIAPQTYRLQSSARAGLRRKLRRAEAAGVTVLRMEAASAPWPALDQIATAWAQVHGRERGFSMGRYSRSYAGQQRLYVAWQHGQPIAFASFHTAPQDWALDLLRHRPDSPDGTMHLLIQTAITDAARARIPRLSLAAVPDGALIPPHDLPARLLAALAPETVAPGLLRFKASFAPHWQPLFTLAPNRPALALGALALARAICRPPPLLPEIEQDHADYGFASDGHPWHTPQNTS